MTVLRTIALVGLALSVAACSRTAGYTPPSSTPMIPPPATTAEPTLPETEQTPSTPIQPASLAPGGYDYLDASAVPLLSSAALSAANDAQFYALQFGRPGAPRNWSSGSASGQVSVGPYVRVNNLDCREFSHRVTVDGQTYSRSGTACREATGAWNVASI